MTAGTFLVNSERLIMSPVFSRIAPALSVLALALIVAVCRFGSVSAAASWVQGNVVHVQKCEVGTVAAGVPVTVVLPVTNLHGDPVTVIGAETDCGCVVAEGLPLEIRGLGTGQFSVVITPRASDQGQVFSRSVSLLLNTNSPSVLIRLKGFVGSW